MSHPEPRPEILSQSTQEIVALFEEALADVRFPDVDAERLRGLAADVWAAQAEVERQRAELLGAEAALRARLEALDALAQRGLAYARVYAESHGELAEHLASIERLHVTQRPEVSPKRGRPKKRATATSDLFEPPMGDVGEQALM